MVSDNGTNLVGGDNELKRAITEWNNTVPNWLKQRSIEWQFNVPTASQHGGAYEREIKTVKKVFHALLNSQNLRLTDENLSTLMCEVESILNERPLTEMTSDPTDTEALTPNHVLLLNAGITFPPGLFDENDTYIRRRWRQVQHLADCFWRRWRQEYLVLLQERSKWTRISPNIKINDLVLVSDVNLPRNNWPLGRVTSVNTDKNGLVRSARIIISRCRNSCITNFDTSVIERPIVKLIKLSPM